MGFDIMNRPARHAPFFFLSQRYAKAKTIMSTMPPMTMPATLPGSLAMNFYVDILQARNKQEQIRWAIASARSQGNKPPDTDLPEAEDEYE